MHIHIFHSLFCGGLVGPNFFSLSSSLDSFQGGYSFFHGIFWVPPLQFFASLPYWFPLSLGSPVFMEPECADVSIHEVWMHQVYQVCSSVIFSRVEGGGGKGVEVLHMAGAHRCLTCNCQDHVLPLEI